MKHAHSFCFILFVSNGLGMCDRLNSQWQLIRSDHTGTRESLWRVEYNLTDVGFASFNAPYKPVRLMVPKIWYMFIYVGYACNLLYTCSLWLVALNQRRRPFCVHAPIFFTLNSNALHKHSLLFSPVKRVVIWRYFEVILT